MICAPVRFAMLASLPDGEPISQIDSYSMTISDRDAARQEGQTRGQTPGQTPGPTLDMLHLVRSLPPVELKE